MDRDSSSGALDVLLLIAMLMPPLLAFVFQSDLDFEAGLGVSEAWSKVRARALDLFGRTVGSCIVKRLGQHAAAPSSTASSSSATPSSQQPRVFDRTSSARLPLPADQADVHVSSSPAAGNQLPHSPELTEVPSHQRRVQIVEEMDEDARDTAVKSDGRASESFAYFLSLIPSSAASAFHRRVSSRTRESKAPPEDCSSGPGATALRKSHKGEHDRALPTRDVSRPPSHRTCRNAALEGSHALTDQQPSASALGPGLSLPPPVPLLQHKSTRLGKAPLRALRSASAARGRSAPVESSAPHTESMAGDGNRTTVNKSSPRGRCDQSGQEGLAVV
jgi:hypothetical protein